MDTSRPPRHPHPNLTTDIVLCAAGGAGVVLTLCYWPAVAHTPSSDAVVTDLATPLALARVFVVALVGIAAALGAALAYRRGCLVWRQAALAAAGGAVLVVSYRLVSAALAGRFAGAPATAAIVAASVVSGAKVFAAVALCGAAGVSLWRRLGRERGLLWLPQADTWTSAAVASLRGYLVAGTALAVVTLSALALKTWCSLPASLVPDAAAVLQLGAPVELAVFVSAAVGATVFELGFRLLGLGLFTAWTARGWLAVLLTAALYALVAPTTDFGPAWLMSPTSQSVAPVFAVGLLFGTVALRYGVAACVAASYLLTVSILSIPLFAHAGGERMALLILFLALPALLAIPGAARAFARWRAGRSAGPQPPVQIDIVGKEALSRIASLRVPRPGAPGPSAFLDDESVIVLAARRTQDFIGYIAVRKAETGPSELLDIFVRASERRQYLGTTLMLEVREILKVEGRRALRATVDESDTASRAFFDAAGLEPSQVIVKSVVPGQ